jgi:predicted nucleic acid-binding protein
MIGGPWVVDASVVVEYLVELQLAPQARRVFAEANTEADLWAPDLLFVECLSALRKLVGRKAITAKEGTRAAQWLHRLPIQITGSRPLVDAMWSQRDALTPYDACYASLAWRLGASLVTADAKLARSLRRKRRRVSLLQELGP